MRLKAIAQLPSRPEQKRFHCLYVKPHDISGKGIREPLIIAQDQRRTVPLGQVIKRGHELGPVLAPIERRLMKLVEE